jgi:hypothetical protein
LPQTPATEHPRDRAHRKEGAKGQLFTETNPPDQRRDDSEQGSRKQPTPFLPISDPLNRAPNNPTSKANS